MESSYDSILNLVFGALNPVKRSVINTHCNVHKFINILALTILANDGFEREYNFFVSYIEDINKGAVWADQDFKHSPFLSPIYEKGAVWTKNAMDLANKYYTNAVTLWDEGDFNKSAFFFGAVLHLIHDMTIPQHANIRLLDNHRQYKLLCQTYLPLCKGVPGKKWCLLT